MVDGLPPRPDRASVPKVAAARRTTRFASRSVSSQSFNTERPPIVLEIGSCVIRVGYAENYKPQHIIPYKPTTKSGSTSNKTLSESQWYLILSPLISQVYDRLMIKSTSRRVVCVHTHCPPKAWIAAMEQIFWNRGVPAVSFVSSHFMVPIAQGWKRGIVVHVGDTEASCAAHVDGHLLEYTFQVVPSGYEAVLNDPTKVECTWTSKMDQIWLDERYPNSIVCCLLKCLEACPRDVRSTTVSNIVFNGDAPLIIPDLGRRVVKRAREILEGASTPIDEQREPSEQGQVQQTGMDSSDLTIVPIGKDTLRPLAASVSLVSCAPHRPDLIGWIGASLWAATWYKYDDDETRINWTKSPEI